ncbi:MAG: adenylate/guanylate cyclase domain-containing protein [Acidobacteria bacterium]|nr:adenylate/guanylate cyclase domain-containing protein [Acidobacteriota bacterium]
MRAYAICMAVTVGALFLYYLTFLGEHSTPLRSFLLRLEQATLDARFQWRGRSDPDPRIVIVDIDQRSQEVLGRWPFPRVHFAHLLDVLREDGARVATFDVTFSQPERAGEPLEELRSRLQRRPQLLRDPTLQAELAELEAKYDYDKLFAAAIERFPAVVLGNWFLRSQADLAGIDNATLNHYDELIAYFPFPQTRPADSAKQDPVAARLRLIKMMDDLNYLPKGAEANLDVLTAALTGPRKVTGFFNIYPDDDGVTRRMPLLMAAGRSADWKDWDFYASIDVQTVRAYYGLSDQEVVLNFGQAGVESVEFGKGLVVQPDELGRVAVNYRGPVRTYRHVSLADVVNRNFASSTFKDKIVLIGATATGIGDLRTTPFGQLDFSGVEIHANMIDTLINQRFIDRQARQAIADVAAILVFGLVLGIWLVRVQPQWMAAALLLAFPFSWFVYRAFVAGAWLNFVLPTATLVSNVLLVAVYRVLIEEQEKRRVRGAFQQYLSPEVIRRLLENPALVQPRKTEITILFCDIRGFTAIAEQLDAQELADLTNEYFTAMTEVIFQRKGTLDKYIGDAVMAFWGAPYEDAQHAANACHAALEMRVRMREMRQRWSATGRPHMDIAVGINTGVASVGNMGSALRYGYTALGDAVNLTSRMESLNRIYGTGILVSETTRALCPAGEIQFREIDVIRVKGKTQPVKIFELLSTQEGGQELKELADLFTRARDEYVMRDWVNAGASCSKLLARWPDDGPAKVLMARCDEFLKNPPPKDWDGVYEFQSK